MKHISLSADCCCRAVYDNIHLFVNDCVSQRTIDPVSKKEVLARVTTAPAAVVGVRDIIADRKFRQQTGTSAEDEAKAPS
ncbi:unnamed protein product, partial [Ectocarpus sp. 12 AP-2014]